MAVLSSRLTSIIPLRCADFSFYQPRLSLRDNLQLKAVDTIIVDDGSPPAVARKLRSFCKSRGYQYLRLDTENLPFSLSRARNAGIRAAATEWLCFEDADLAYTKDFHQRLIHEAALLDQTPFNFLTVPVIYLNEQATSQIMDAGGADAIAAEFITAAAIENPIHANGNTTVQSYAPASSLIVVEKTLAMAIGAFDEQFVGWGGEDRDFVFRLLLANARLPEPRHFDITKPWNLNDTVAYEGWRSLYRMHGDYAALKGLYSFHLFHDELPWKGGQKAFNMQYAAEKAKQLTKTRSITPAYDPAKPSDIILGRNPHLLNAQVLCSLTNPRVVEEDPACDPVVFADRIASASPLSVVFWNSFGTPWRRAVYLHLRSKSVTTIVAERGALPHTIYFDTGGLCLESPSYQLEVWDHPISDAQRKRVKTYIDDLMSGNEALERQAGRIGSAMLRLKLGIPADRKILFVALQLPDDTVTTNLVEPLREYQAFLLEIHRLSLSLPRDWIMVVKQHPLATEQVALPSALNGDAFHINDLLTAADAVCVYNSGVGLLALAAQKPTFYYGRAFYGLDGLCRRFENARWLCDALAQPDPPDRELMLRFYSYLINDFYSFADWTGSVAKASSTSNKFILERISYRTVRIPGREARTFAGGTDIDLKRSVLFDRYRFCENATKRQNATSGPPAKHLTEWQVAGVEAFKQRDYLAAAQNFEHAAAVAESPSTHLRAAAEAYDKAGSTQEAIKRLESAVQIARNTGSIKRRIREMSRPRWLRKILREKPFPIERT